ncbi:hypothetical protein C8Q76DRAFT_422064 [Earliella scabrosa]|nr:hypothetical protein C8Q76DRAFT_422064 [Earliella scabrosa]
MVGRQVATNDTCVVRIIINHGPGRSDLCRRAAARRSLCTPPRVFRSGGMRPPGRDARRARIVRHEALCRVLLYRVIKSDPWIRTTGDRPRLIGTAASRARIGRSDCFGSCCAVWAHGRPGRVPDAYPPCEPDPGLGGHVDKCTIEGVWYVQLPRARGRTFLGRLGS